MDGVRITPSILSTSYNWYFKEIHHFSTLSTGTCAQIMNIVYKYFTYYKSKFGTAFIPKGLAPSSRYV